MKLKGMQIWVYDVPRTFTFKPNDPATRNAAELAVFGVPLADQDDYPNLIGDIAGDAEVRVIFNLPFSKTKGVVPITISAKCSTRSSVVRLDKGMFDYSDCTVVHKGRGTGRKVFELPAKTAQGLGIKEITAEGRNNASVAMPCWGHITYPGYGFDQPPSLPRLLLNCQRI